MSTKAADCYENLTGRPLKPDVAADMRQRARRALKRIPFDPSSNDRAARHGAAAFVGSAACGIPLYAAEVVVVPLPCGASMYRCRRHGPGFVGAVPMARVAIAALAGPAVDREMVRPGLMTYLTVSEIAREISRRGDCRVCTLRWMVSAAVKLVEAYEDEVDAAARILEKRGTISLFDKDVQPILADVRARPFPEPPLSPKGARVVEEIMKSVWEIIV